MEIVLVGLNHRTAPVEVREKVSFTAEQARRVAEELRARGILEETLVRSTCNRSEVYGVPPDFSHECAPGLSTFLSEFHSVLADVLSVSLYHHYDHEAVRHLFRVAAGLDSMLLGEAEILGQVREAYRFAHEHGATGPVLNRLFQGALEVGKRVRTETELGTRPMSVASAGVRLAEHIFGKLHGHKALVLGAGTASEQVVEHVAKLLSWQASVELVGLVDGLRMKMREERATFIRARMEPMKHLTETDRAHVEQLMDEMLEKLLLEPAERLRGEKELRRKIQNVEALRDLFLSNREKR